MFILIHPLGLSSFENSQKDVYDFTLSSAMSSNNNLVNERTHTISLRFISFTRNDDNEEGDISSSLFKLKRIF